MKKIREFTQPTRRNTRQRSGYKVSGLKTGSECVLTNPESIEFREILEISFKETNVQFTELFNKDLVMYGFGGYIKSKDEIFITSEITILDEKGRIILSISESSQHIGDFWFPFSTDILSSTEVITDNECYVVEGKIKIKSEKETNTVSLIGLQYGAVKYYENRAKYYDFFIQKTHLYKPDIYYLTHKSLEDFTVFSPNSTSIIDSKSVVLKSCNRCSRYLPIDILNERNSLSFSNHCKLRAPCTHNAFSRYRIEGAITPTEDDKKLEHFGNSYFINTYYGFQLECRTCKKFEVNAPLNPLRDRAQHHEDGARRRALEKLIIELSQEDKIKNFRITNNVEFPNYIINKFGNKCFACKKHITLSTMDIDHTLPLLYLWPLDETATALCKTCNSEKHDLFPKQYKKYTPKHIIDLSKITGIPLEILNSEIPIVNPTMMKLLINNVVWFFDEFLTRKDYKKIKKGKLVADLIYKAINKTLSNEGISLVKIYYDKTNNYPKSISLNKN